MTEASDETKTPCAADTIFFSFVRSIFCWNNSRACLLCVVLNRPITVVLKVYLYKKKRKEKSNRAGRITAAIHQVLGLRPKRAGRKHKKYSEKPVINWIDCGKCNARLTVGKQPRNDLIHIAVRESTHRNGCNIETENGDIWNCNRCLLWHIHLAAVGLYEIRNA